MSKVNRLNCIDASAQFRNQYMLPEKHQFPVQNLKNTSIQSICKPSNMLYYKSAYKIHLFKKLYGYHVIQADETPCLVNKDGREAGSKSYMWAYRSGHLYADKQIVLYDYQKTRNLGTCKTLF